MTIKEFSSIPKDSPEEQENIIRHFGEEAAKYPELVKLREFVEQNSYGFGCFAFYAFYKMVVEAVDKDTIKFLEIGVYKGQVIALMKVLEKLCGKSIDVYGVTPLNSSDNHVESDYANDIQYLHRLFKLKQPEIIKGYSQHAHVIEKTRDYSPFDIILIDGHHGYAEVKQDLLNYTDMVIKGGYLIMDDSANNMPCIYEGGWWGLQSVSDAVDEFLPPNTDNDNWEYLGMCMHNRLWKRIE